MTPLADGQQHAHLGLRMLTNLRCEGGRCLPKRPPRAAWTLTRPIELLFSLAKLTAKVTAKPHATRGPQGMTLDGSTRPELCRCSRP